MERTEKESGNRHAVVEVPRNSPRLQRLGRGDYGERTVKPRNLILLWKLLKELFDKQNAG